MGKESNLAEPEEGSVTEYLNIYDSAFAAEQTKVFEEDKRKSRLMTRSEFKNRSKVGKIFDEIAGTLRRQL